MPRKTILVIIICVLIFVVGLFGIFYYFNRDGETPLGETLRDILPFGLSPEDIGFDAPSFTGFMDEGDGGNGPNDENPIVDNGEAVFQNLRQLTTIPVSGAFASSSNNKVIILYIERQTGHVYEIDGEGSSRKRITNTTIPAVYESFFGDDGKVVLMRYLDENDVIKTFKGKVVSSGETDGEALDGSFLLDDIPLIAVSPRKDQFFTWAPFGKVSVGTASQFKNGENKELFTSPFDEWLIEWPTDTLLSFTTKPSAQTGGFLYLLNTKTKAFDKILGSVLGLTTRVAPDGTSLVYSENDTELFFKTHLYNVKTRTRTDFPVRTLPEKCVWSTIKPRMLYCGVPEQIQEGEYPDQWYQGLVFFSDSIWKIDTETGSVDILAIPKTLARQEIDLVRPMLDKNEEYLIFTNKRDGALWSLKL